MAVRAGEPGAKVIPCQFKSANECDKKLAFQMEYETFCTYISLLSPPAFVFVRASVCRSAHIRVMPTQRNCD